MRGFLQQHFRPATPNAINQGFEYMTLAFLVLRPVAIDFLTVRVAQAGRKLPLSQQITLPAGMWSDAVMGTLQGSILRVVQRRCETAAVAQKQLAGARLAASFQ